MENKNQMTCVNNDLTFRKLFTLEIYSNDLFKRLINFYLIFMYSYGNEVVWN
jgi:hypothetical protein